MGITRPIGPAAAPRVCGRGRRRGAAARRSRRPSEARPWAGDVRMSDERNPTPEHLGTAGAELWHRMTEDVAYDDPSELETLRKACELEDTAATLAAALEGARLIVTGSKGQDVPHPLLAELRLTRAEVARLLARIRM